MKFTFLKKRKFWLRFSGVLIGIPIILFSVVLLIVYINQDEISKLQKVIKDQNEAPGVRERARLKLEFWEIYLPKALDTTIGAGTYDKLIQLKNELKVTV